MPPVCTNTTCWPGAMRPSRRAGDEAGQGLAGVHRVEHQALEAGGQVEGPAAIVGGGAVVGAEVVVVDHARPHRSGPAREGGHLRRLGRHLLVEVGPGADVDAEHLGVVAEPGDQAGVRPARPVGDDHQLDVGELRDQLVGRIDVAESAHRRGPADGHAIRAPALPARRSHVASMAVSVP